MIKTISFQQDEILNNILRLYVPNGCFEVDSTYGSGGFYKTNKVPLPTYRFDLSPQSADVEKSDSRHLPFEDSTVGSILFDPPFLATKGPSLQTCYGNCINRRFTVCQTETELYELYQDSIREAHRVLRPGGVFVFKCQDKVSSGKQHMMHCDVYNWAISHGFEVLDLFVLLAKSRLIADWQRNQKHARKYHCYFWVFRKRRLNTRSNTNADNSMKSNTSCNSKQRRKPHEEVLELGQE